MAPLQSLGTFFYSHTMALFFVISEKKRDIGRK